ncbi:unnamed protein product, partial [Tilletia laevis]
MPAYEPEPAKRPIEFLDEPQSVAGPSAARTRGRPTGIPMLDADHDDG